MFERHQNQVGDINGDHNQVIQIILQDGNKVAEKLGTLIDRLLNKEKEEIETLKKRIADKEEAIADKSKILGLQDSEIIRLKTALAEKQQQLEESEARFAQTFLENDGKDFTGSKELYPKALQLLTEGKKAEALAVLNRHELLEEKRKLDQEKEQQAESWLLRADLLKEEGQWDETLNECYDYAAEIHPTLGNLLTAANHYAFINRIDVAQQYYELCLAKASADTERAITLINLANLRCDKNEFAQAQASYQEALEIYRKLAKANPQTYLPYVATTLNNLAILQRDKNKFAQAQALYQEALEIYRKLAKVDPQTYLLYLAGTLNNLAILQCDKNEHTKAEASYDEALEIYQELVQDNPEVYLPGLGMNITNLANLQRNKNEYTKAEASYEEALEIYRKLAQANPQTYLPDLASTQINMSIFYQKSKIDEELSIQLVDEAITNLLPFSKIPYIQNYLKVAFAVLKKWDIDEEAYLKEKLASEGADDKNSS